MSKVVGGIVLVLAVLFVVGMTTSSNEGPTGGHLPSETVESSEPAPAASNNGGGGGVGSGGGSRNPTPAQVDRCLQAESDAAYYGKNDPRGKAAVLEWIAADCQRLGV